MTQSLSHDTRAATSSIWARVRPRSARWSAMSAYDRYNTPWSASCAAASAGTALSALGGPIAPTVGTHPHADDLDVPLAGTPLDSRSSIVRAVIDAAS